MIIKVFFPNSDNIPGTHGAASEGSIENDSKKTI
jgi:hypothetical protein